MTEEFPSCLVNIDQLTSSVIIEDNSHSLEHHEMVVKFQNRTMKESIVIPHGQYVFVHRRPC